jgi:hypothetical protein
VIINAPIDSGSIFRVSSATNVFIDNAYVKAHNTIFRYFLSSAQDMMGENITIQNSYFETTSDQPIYIQNQQNGSIADREIKNVIIHNNRLIGDKHGIYLQSQNGDILNVKITDNYISCISECDSSVRFRQDEGIINDVMFNNNVHFGVDLSGIANHTEIGNMIWNT